MKEPNFVVSERFERALQRAVELHRSQGRKGSGVPYVGHLLSVAGTVLEDGGSEDEAVAALLHDAIEDQFRDGLVEALTADFGERVTSIVQGCSQDKQPGEELSWRQRKQRYIDHMRSASGEVLRVSLADKLCNVRSMLRDHRDHGDALWGRFGADDREALLWYYDDLAEIYSSRRPGAMADEFAHEVRRLRSALGLAA